MKTLLIALLVGAIGVWAGYTLEHHIKAEAWHEVAEMRFRQGWDEGFGYAISNIKHFTKYFVPKVNWQPYNVPLPERSVR